MICIDQKKLRSSVSSDSLQWIFAGAKQLGLDVDEAVAACGVQFSAADFRAGRVRSLSPAAYCDLYFTLNYLIQNRTLEKYGRRGFLPDHFSLMCNSIITAADLAEAITRLCTFFDLAHERFEGDFGLGNQGENVHFHMDMGWQAGDSQTEREIERKSLFLFYYLFSWLIGRPIELDSVTFRMESLQDLGEWSTKFRCEVQTGQACNGFVFSASYLSLPNVQNYSRLLKFLQEYPYLMNLPVTAIGTEVSDYVEQTMMTLCLKEARFPSLLRLAELCGYSESSLSRKLRAEGKTYSDVKERCQLSLAKTYMWRPELSIADIALLLGFSSSNSFSRAFSKWTGKPPAEYRRNMVLEPKG